jgi:hypothetical protein
MSHVDANDATSPVPTIRSGDADILRLAVAQALGGANSAVVFAIGAIVGNMLAPARHCPRCRSRREEHFW